MCIGRRWGVHDQTKTAADCVTVIEAAVNVNSTCFILDPVTESLNIAKLVKKQLTFESFFSP